MGITDKAAMGSKRRTFKFCSQKLTNKYDLRLGVILRV